MAHRFLRPPVGIARRASSILSRPHATHTIGALEHELLANFPADDAESWDYTGLIAGDPRKAIKRVAIALDPTDKAIKRAQENGANVLVTHHPLRYDADEAIVPSECGMARASSVLWTALESDVALMCFHTALDVSLAAQQVLPGMLGLKFESVLAPILGSPRKGYGQVCSLLDADPLTLQHLAARCLSVFGRPPRVWGDLDTQLSSIVTCTGSEGGCARKALEAGCDCVVCGEIKYHEALALAEAGLCIIELGHDVSELPLVAPLAAAIEKAGVAKEDIILIDQSGYWCCPEAVRI